MSLTRRKTGIAFAGATVLALSIAACSSGSTPTTSGSTDGGSTGGDQITLTLATFNTPGYNSVETAEGNYQYDLIQEYMDLHPNIKIVYDRKAESGDARENFFTKLGSGGLADVEMVEVDWMPEVMQYSDLLADLSDPSIEGRWLESVEAAATDADGRLIGGGTDVGPQAICYRSSLFEAAGLPGDPEGVAELLKGDWAHFFSVGADYSAKTGKAFYDSTGGIWQGMIGQIDPAYEDAATGDIIVLDNANVKAAYDQLSAASATQSTKYGQWGEDWNAGMSNGDYAVMLCPPWMLGVISGNSTATDWNIANVYPNGGGNWGGSWLTVPADGKNVEAAKEFVLWLTAPEQQAKAFANAGTYPSQPAAYDDPAVSGAVNEFFNNAPIGKIFADRAKATPTPPFKGKFYFQINDAISNALARVDQGTDDAASSWTKAVADIEALG